MRVIEQLIPDCGLPEWADYLAIGAWLVKKYQIAWKEAGQPY